MLLACSTFPPACLLPFVTYRTHQLQAQDIERLLQWLEYVAGEVAGGHVSVLSCMAGSPALRQCKAVGSFLVPEVCRCDWGSRAVWLDLKQNDSLMRGVESRAASYGYLVVVEHLP
jgi:hypothetical protein